MPRNSGALNMKKIITSILFSFLIISCTEEKPLELFSPEAFAFSLDSGWELNASVNVKGFNQVEDDEDFYHANLNYSVDFITPENDTLKRFDFGSIVEKSDEEFLDLTIEVQAEIDSNFTSGLYTLIFYVSDQYSEKDTSIVKVFELSE